MAIARNRSGRISCPAASANPIVREMRLSWIARIFGIIPGVNRLRKSVGTTAVKSPEQMRDVA